MGSSPCLPRTLDPPVMGGGGCWPGWGWEGTQGPGENSTAELARQRSEMLRKLVKDKQNVVFSVEETVIQPEKGMRH